MNKSLLIALIGCSYTTLCIAESDYAKLKHNPFEKPILELTDSPRKATNYKQIVPQFELRAVIVSSSMPMANVDGNILEIGHEYNGLKLIAVKEGQAKFDWNGTKIWLKIGMNQVNNLDDN